MVDSSHSEVEKSEVVVESNSYPSSTYSQSAEDNAALRAAYRRIDFLILPLLFLGFFGLQLDRGNIANALTDTILADLKITTDTINTGTQVLSAGIIIFVVPSNMILQKVGARKWITGQIILWGLVATLQSLVKTRSTFLLTRFILGACEAGFIPGSLYYLSTWYRKDQYAKRNTVFFLGNQFGTACSGILASGILKLAGKHGIAGWRWLFMIDGLITIFIGLLWLVFLPESPTNPSPLLLPGVKYLDDKSGQLIRQHVVHDDPEKINDKVAIKPKHVLNVFLNWRIWQHVVVTFIPMAATSMTTYFPSIVKKLGYTKVQANAMSSIGYFLAIPFQFALGYYSDKSKHRGIAVIIPQALAAIFIGLIFGLDGPKSKFVAIVFAQIVFFSFHVMNVTWTSANCIVPAQRSIALAGVVMSANLSQLAGAPIFGAKYAPTYRTPFIVCLTLMCFGTLFSSLVVLGYYLSNKRIANQNMDSEKVSDEIVDTSEESARELATLHPGKLQKIRRQRRMLYVW